MKNIDLKRISKYIAMVMGAAFIISILLFFTTGGIADTLDKINAMEKKVHKEASFDVNGVETIYIKSVSQDVNIIPEDRSDVLVQLSGYTTGRIPDLEARQNGGTINIEVEYRIWISFGFSYSNTKLNVYVPRNYSKKLDIKTTSGKITVDGLWLDTFKGKSVSGNISLRELQTISSKLETTSGDMKLDGFTGDLEAKSVSGNMEIDCKESSQNFTLSSSSGKIAVNNFKGGIEARTISGNIKINYVEFLGNTAIKSTSGDVKLGLPENSAYTLQAKSVSGDIEAEFPVEITGKNSEHSLNGVVRGGSNLLKINTTSGNIDIEKR